MISWQVLKDRKLAQWALAYLAGAWVVLQVLDLLAQPFAWPVLVLRAAVVLLGVGFFAVLVVAWYHGERGTQRVSGPELLMLAGIFVVAGAAVAFVSRGRSGAPAAAAGRDATATAAAPAAAAEQGSIAVLPFLDLSPKHDQEYFSDGLADELLDALTRLPGLRVASRTSAFAFRGMSVSIDSIGRALRVGNVLEGSVRKEGDRVRITAQLISAGTGYHLWSETYDRELKDVFAVQDEISRAIVNALALKLSGGQAARLVKEGTSDPQAHDLALKGDYFAHQGNRAALARAVDLLGQAIRRDTTYARAWAELANAFSQQAYARYGPREALVAKAREAATRALALDSTQASAQFALGRLAWQQDWDPRAAEAHYRRAIELNPGLAVAHSQRGWVLMDMGRTAEALAEAKRATELDPVSAGMLNNLGGMYNYAGQAEQAVQAFRAAIALQPNSSVALANLAATLSVAGRHQEAIRTAEQARALDPQDQYTLAVLAYGYARAGRRADAERALAALQSQPEPSPYLVATAYAGLGAAAKVFEFLERAVAQKDESALDLGVDPVFDPYRGDPRMRPLLDRILAH